MLNEATKFALGVAGFAAMFAIAVVLRIGQGDRAAALMLVAAAIGAAIVAFAVGRALGTDAAPFAGPDTAPVSTAIDPAEIAAPSVMPLLAAAGVTLAVAGGALGPELVVEGLVVAALGFGGWLAGAWRTHPGFTPRDAANLDDRLLGPVALPIVAFVVTAIVAVSFSRVLLAVSKTASWVIALIVAAVLLAVLWMLANRRALATRFGPTLAGAGLVAVLLAGGAGAAAGPREFHHIDTHKVVRAEVVAKDIQFQQDTIELPADRATEIVFTNLDIGVNHNVSVYTAEEPGTPVFAGPPILKGDITYKLRTPAPGVYRYICDFHPAMVGNLNVIRSANETQDLGSDEEDEH